MILPIHLPQNSYDVILQRGALAHAGEYLALDRRVLIVTDGGVPAAYAAAIASQCAAPVTVTVEQGERSKSLQTLEMLLRAMLTNDFTRRDCVVAVGGGMAGDLAGFAAAVYMRGVDFYNVPTTLLAQVDSSIGGKTAVDLDGIKNVIGSFYQPRRVLIDPDVLSTLPRRQLSAGLAEAMKMGLTSDAALFALFETEDPAARLDEIIWRSLRIKADVVMQDEKEQGLRRILNFGHTLGHAIESCDGLKGLLHGECVALGMLPMCAPPVRRRVRKALERLSLPTRCQAEDGALLAALRHDKKAAGQHITVVTVPQVGQWEMQELSPEQVLALLPLLREETA
ncbi:MAG: 3-dehydroquinate synthase [Oscillospiraceae bacterium]|nr:3-dehydroquinate synthase [Oscillospiraceae bacterium]